MKKLLCFMFIVIVLFAGAFVYMSQRYSEKRWIPKTVLNLPKFSELPQNLESSHSVQPLPQSALAIADENNFEIVFDRQALPYLTLEKPWSEQKNALELYGKKVELNPDKIQIGIVLFDVGLDEKLFENALHKLPPVVTLSFSPYALDLASKITNARLNGFENMFDLAVDEDASGGQGAYALNKKMPVAEMKRRLKKYYFGVNVPFAGFIVPSLESENFEELIRRDINQKGLTFVNLKNADTIENDLLYAEALNAFFENVITHAHTAKGHAHIIALPMTALTVDVIAKWAGMNELPNVEFVPASNLPLP